jgi:trans-aconitate 2-methyltransferase
MKRVIKLDWSSSTYLKFAKERTQPAIDLAMRLQPMNAEKIIDIGCGPGNSTAVLKQLFPKAYILGIDNSQNMIEKARCDHRDIDFAHLDAANDLDTLSDRFDIVFSNACIQWIPNHKKLLKELFGLLKKGGTLAVQIPINDKEPIHQIIREVAESIKWRDKFDTPRVFYNLTPNEYHDVLSQLSNDFTIWETTYYHRLPSYEDIVEWYKGTGLRPYLAMLNPSDRADFEAEIFAMVKQRYSIQENHEIIFKFPRLFFTATKTLDE